MQPYFFPYLGHFALISRVDQWLVFDITQYTPKSWMSRNRVLHPQHGWNYVNMNLSNASISLLSCEARVLNMERSRLSVLGKLSHYRRSAPYYREVTGLVGATFDAATGDSLVGINVAGLRMVCMYLGIPFDYRLCSELELDLPTNLGPGDWAPAICSQIGATAYLNPAGGRHLFASENFERQGIALEFLDYEPFAYATGPYTFETNLSILDVLMWNSPTTVLDHILKGHHAHT